MSKPVRKKYLLAIPRLIRNAGDGYSFPLGIPYISASLKKAGHQVVTLNLNHCAGEVADVLAGVIARECIDVVATGGLSFQYHMIRHLVELVKRIDPRIVTIVGGGIISGDPEPAMTALEHADFGVVGEGEQTMCELCRTLEEGGDPSRVDGLIYRQGDRYVLTRARREIDDIDTLPWPDYEGFGLETYLKLNPPGISGLNKPNTLFMCASRSCPYSCTFCFHTAGKRYRQRSMDAFFTELDHLVARYPVRYLCLADELFAHSLPRVRQFCERIKSYGIRWWAQFRVSDVTPELLALVKGSGCDVMSFGLESADNRILKSMRKGTTVEQIEWALKLVYDAGISMEGAFIFGDVEETPETVANTLKWWREHSQYKISLNFITVFPGSPLYHHACAKGLITDRVKFLREGCPQLNVSKLSDSEMAELGARFMDAAMSQVKTLTTCEITSVDYRTGRIAVTGQCVSCSQPNRWTEIKLFTTNFISCNRCGQKYNIPLTAELRTNIARNVKALLARYGKVGVWGINYHAADLFKTVDIFRDPNVYPIDISTTKQAMSVSGKRVRPPGVIGADGVRAVIIAIPLYFTQIAAQIESNHPDVQAVIDVCWLTDPNYSAAAGSGLHP